MENTMTRILFTTNAMDGHARPCLSVAQALRNAGHEVHWYTGQAYERLVRNADAGFTPFSVELERDNTGTIGLLNLNKCIIDVFLSRIPDFMADLARVFDAFEPEVVVADHAFMAGPMLAEQRNIARVCLSTGPLNLCSTDTAPFGTGLAPSATSLGRIRNRLLNWIVYGLLMRGAQQMAVRIRAEMGLPPLRGFFVDWTALISDRFLQPTVPEFEYPRKDLPPSVEFTGVTLTDDMDDWVPPAWWADLAAAREAGRPVVFVTQGTVATDPANLLLPTIAALADAETLVVAACGRREPEQIIPAAQRPANLRIASFIPYTKVLPFADVMITNGGYGGVQTALTHGVPLVTAGTSEDKQEVNARVAWSGAGVSLRTDRPRPERIEAAVRKVLTEPSHRARAQALRDANAQYSGAQRAAEIILAAADARRLPVTGHVGEPVDRESARQG
jgi:UDP:flavonoid glycosyltransferase YjiC (YdhE family)